MEENVICPHRWAMLTGLQLCRRQPGGKQFLSGSGNEGMCPDDALSLEMWEQQWS